MLKSSCCFRTVSTSLALALCLIGNVSSPQEIFYTQWQEHLSPSSVHPPALVLGCPAKEIANREGKAGETLTKLSSFSPTRCQNYVCHSQRQQLTYKPGGELLEHSALSPPSCAKRAGSDKKRLEKSCLFHSILLPMIKVTFRLFLLFNAEGIS